MAAFLDGWLLRGEELRSARLTSLAGVGVLLVACSEGEASDGPGGVAGAGGSEGAEESLMGGASGQPGSIDGGLAMLSVERVCELFAEASCNQISRCGVFVAEVEGGVDCLACFDPERRDSALGALAGGCEAALLGPKPAAEVEACLTSLRAQACQETCAAQGVEGCQVLQELAREGTGDIGPSAAGAALGADAGVPLDAIHQGALCDPLCVGL